MKLKKSSSIYLSTIFSALTSTSVFADDICGNTNIPEDIRAASGCNTGDVSDLPTVIVNILNAIILVSGLISVIFIIVGGVSYMTSSGDASKVKKAKDTILYACIGLVICVLSFAIINWVIGILAASSTS